MRHTIYALSTVYGKSAIAIFRISGKEAARTFDIFKLNQPKPKTPALVKIFDGKTFFFSASALSLQSFRLCKALCKGVEHSSSSTFTFAPLFIKKLTAFSDPCSAL